MKQERTGFSVVVMCSAILTGCANSPPAMESGAGKDEFVPCQEPRPEFCTMHHAPVCGVLTGGSSKTYSNACGACSDRAVKGYTEDACVSGGR